MPSTRFPRTAYARRAAQLAEELAEWRASYLEFARGPDNWVHTDAEVNKREDRAAVLHDLVHELQNVALQLHSLR